MYSGKDTSIKLRFFCLLLSFSDSGCQMDGRQLIAIATTLDMHVCHFHFCSPSIAFTRRLLVVLPPFCKAKVCRLLMTIPRRELAQQSRSAVETQITLCCAVFESLSRGLPEQETSQIGYCPGIWKTLRSRLCKDHEFPGGTKKTSLIICNLFLVNHKVSAL